MPPPDALVACFAAAVLLALAPGPDNLFVLAQSARYGPAAGLSITAGLCTGLLAHTTAVVLGMAALLQAYPAAFGVLRTAGAVYLLYLAWQALRADGNDTVTGSAARLSVARYYRRGIIMNLTNPKVAMFFLALLPQFASPAHVPLAGQLALLGALFILATLLVFGAIALLAGWTGAWLGRTPAARALLRYGAAAVLAGLALKLLLASR